MKDFFSTVRGMDEVTAWLKGNGGYVIQTTKGCFITQDNNAETLFQSKTVISAHAGIDLEQLDNRYWIASSADDNTVKVLPVKFADIKGVYCCDFGYYSESVTFGLDYVVTVIKL